MIPNVLKREIDRSIKSWGCADSRPQKIYTRQKRCKLTYNLNRSNDVIMFNRCKK